MIRLLGVGKVFAARDGSRVEALKDVSIDVKPGEFLTLLGPSGCGKTTLLDVVAGLSEPDYGSVHVDGFGRNNSFGWAGYMPQEDTLLPWRTVLENAEIGLEIRGVPRSTRRERTQTLLRQVGLQGFEDKFPFELSGGMKRRVGLVRMLAYDPAVLLLDEPFAALDSQTREFLHDDLLCLWQQSRKTVIFVTHDLLEAIVLSDRIILLTARPARVKREYVIPWPRPRDPALLQGTSEYVSLYRALRSDLLEEVADLRACRHEDAPGGPL
ncbi:MAG: ABC transporter ATP-binding protein [Pseudomonadota bacterium]